MNKITGFLAHLERETIRFFTVPNNTIAPGLVSTFLYLIIFGIGLGRNISIPNMDYLDFLVPGLIMLNLINGAYSNPSGSLFMSRWRGHIEDILTSPLSHMSMVWAYVIGGMARGLTMGIGTLLIAIPFTNIRIVNPLSFIAFMLLTSILFSCFGILIGLWAEEFEQLNIFLNFLITPLIFLGGVFYSVQHVPETIRGITEMNPLYYMINGVRYGMTGFHDGASLLIGLLILISLTAGMLYLCYYLFKKGWHLRT